MIGHIGTFLKKDGSLRTMKFVKIEELPETFISSKLKGNKKKRTLSEGMETVWDLESENFRIFNWEKKVGEIKDFELKETELQ